MKHAVVLMVVFVMMFVMVAPASADPARVAANGSWNDCNFGAVSRTVGPIVVVKVQITQNFFGTLDGKYVGPEFDACPDGIFSGTYEGSVKVGR